MTREEKKINIITVPEAMQKQVRQFNNIDGKQNKVQLQMYTTYIDCINYFWIIKM